MFRKAGVMNTVLELVYREILLKCAICNATCITNLFFLCLESPSVRARCLCACVHACVRAWLWMCESASVHGRPLCDVYFGFTFIVNLFFVSLIYAVKLFFYDVELNSKHLFCESDNTSRPIRRRVDNFRASWMPSVFKSSYWEYCLACRRTVDLELHYKELNFHLTGTLMAC